MPRRPGRYSSLNGEDKVRARLFQVAQTAQGDQALVDTLRGIDFLRAPADEILARSEKLIAEALPAYFPTPHTLLDALGRDTWPLIDLIVVQSIGARQGHWLVRDAELADAKIARDLHRDAGPFNPMRQAQLHAAAKTAYANARYGEAVTLLSEADRGERSAVGLLQMAVALWRAENPLHALHIIRACLLEEPDTFPNAEAYLSAAKVESSLRRSLENAAATTEQDRASLKVIEDPNARPSYGARARP